MFHRDSLATQIPAVHDLSCECLRGRRDSYRNANTFDEPSALINVLEEKLVHPVIGSVRFQQNLRISSSDSSAICSWPAFAKIFIVNQQSGWYTSIQTPENLIGSNRSEEATDAYETRSRVLYGDVAVGR